MKNYKLICVLFCALCIVFSCAKKKEEYGDAESAESTVITYPSVDRTSPSNAQTSVSVSSPIKVTFTKEMDPDSITSNDSDAGYVCTGTIQVSKDDFVNCVKISSSPVSTDNVSYQLIPKENLTYDFNYKIFVKKEVVDKTGNNMNEDFVTISGFTTITEPDNTPPTIVSVTPSNESDNISVNTPILITFHEAMMKFMPQQKQTMILVQVIFSLLKLKILSQHA